MKKAPCTNCDQRRIGCHSTCADYIEWKKGRDAILDARAKENSSMPEMAMRIRRELWKWNKRKSNR